MNVPQKVEREGRWPRKMVSSFNKELSGYINCHSLLLVYIYIISVKFHSNFCPNCYFFLSARKELNLESLWILFNGSQKKNGSSENVNPSLGRT